MDNWHVTAVRYCIVNGITWYELYDSDDGDYYGWVDEDHIDFANYVTQEPGISDKYTTYDTSAATADFNFNDNQFGYGGTVVTENDPLNLRAAPSSNSEVIIQMPKGANVFIFGYNNDWYYVCYKKNGVTYYGYASCQFIAASDI